MLTDGLLAACRAPPLGKRRRKKKKEKEGKDVLIRVVFCVVCLIALARKQILPTTFLLYSLYNWARPNVGGYAKIPNSIVNQQEEMGHR